MKRATLAIAMGLMAGSAYAQPDATAYQLQERCSKSAQQVFQREYDDGKPVKSDGLEMTFNYRAHYSPRLNKCFYLEMGSSVNAKAMTRIYRLFDLHENKEYATFANSTADDVTICIVQGTLCRSEAEWRQLTKQYLEE